jgi:hypothetical protein|tara:strand:+ start:2095 stop:2277 length:183 start_codon:yes stop_codon:yes gene_type:complete
MINQGTMNTVFIDEYSNQKKEIQILRTVSQRLAKEKQELEIKNEILIRTIADLRDKLEEK